MREIVFTLAVVVILAAFLLPRLGPLRDNNRRSSCQSNLKQMGLGLLQYTRDYDESYPLAITGELSASRTWAHTTGWADAIQPYIKNARIYQCPAEDSTFNTDPLGVGYSDYWYNCALSWNGKTGKAARWNANVSLEKLSAPQLMVTFGDADPASGVGTARTRSNGFAATDIRDLASPSTAAALNGKVAGSGFAGGGFRHMGGLNVAFADGHVKWLPSTGPNTSATIYNFNTPFSRSGQNPTFNAIKP